MIRLFANAQYDFIKWRRWAFSLTGAIMLVGLGFLVTRGVNYSIEFTGGTQVQVEAAHKLPIAKGLAAVSATAHAVVATIAFISVMPLEVSLVVVGAVLTVVGYSLNDTIIIFDRVRENLRKYRRQNLYEILNLSINETLPRSVLTHGTTIATTLALLLLAGEVIRPLAWVLSFGIFTGTFSSIYIAAPVLLWIEKRWPGEDARGARAFGTRAPAKPPDFAPATPTSSPSPRTPQPTR